MHFIHVVQSNEKAVGMPFDTACPNHKSNGHTNATGALLDTFKLTINTFTSVVTVKFDTEVEFSNGSKLNGMRRLVDEHNADAQVQVEVELLDGTTVFSEPLRVPPHYTVFMMRTATMSLM